MQGAGTEGLGLRVLDLGCPELWVCDLGFRN